MKKKLLVGLVSLGMVVVAIFTIVKVASNTGHAGTTQKTPRRK